MNGPFLPGSRRVPVGFPIRRTPGLDFSISRKLAFTWWLLDDMCRTPNHALMSLIRALVPQWRRIEIWGFALIAKALLIMEEGVVEREGGGFGKSGGLRLIRIEISHTSSHAF